MSVSVNARSPSSADVFSKTAAVTLVFWLLKILATTLGETSGDLLSLTLGLGYVTALALTAGLFVVLVGAQLLAGRFSAWRFWAVILATTMLGTEVSDTLDRTVGMGYTAGAGLLAAWLGATLLIWKWTVGPLRVFPITGYREECFYWTAILAANSLGTAFGDFLSDSLQLGYVTAAAITAGVIALVAVLHWATSWPAIVLFWLAFVFTRPFGATFGDLLTKPTHQGGLALGTAGASAVALGLAVAVIAIGYRRTGQDRRG